jgi:hypothetical protein
MIPGTPLERRPDLMSPEERVQEVARLLARAYLRRRQKEKALALSAGEPLLSTAGAAPPQEGDACRTS